MRHCVRPPSARMNGQHKSQRQPAAAGCALSSSLPMTSNNRDVIRFAHRWRCHRAAMPRSLRYRECLRRLSIRIDTPHARLVSSLTHQVSLRSGVSMLTAPRHTRPLRPSCHGGTGFTGTSPCPGQTSLRPVAQGEACGRAIDPVVRPSAIGHQVGHRPFPATLVGTPPALTAWCNCTNGEVHLRIAPLVIA